MKRSVLVLIGSVLPLLTFAQSASDLVTQGNDKKAHGDLKGALALYNQAITKDPREVTAYLARGTARGQQGDYKGAIADDTKAISLDPKNPSAYTNRGNAKAARHDLEGALADYNQALALDPNHTLAFLNRGNIKNLQKKYHPAIDDYTSALMLSPKNAAAFYNRAGAKRSLGDYAGATDDYTQAIQINPSDVQSYLNRAILEITGQKWNDAKDDLNKSLSLIPKERQAYARIFLWVVDVKQGDVKAATDDLASHLKSDAKPLGDTWGWTIAKYLTGQMKENDFLAQAQTLQAKKGQNRGQVAQSLYYVAIKRQANGDKTGANSFFNKCVKASDPSMHEFILAREELKYAGSQH